MHDGISSDLRSPKVRSIHIEGAAGWWTSQKVAFAVNLVTKLFPARQLTWLPSPSTKSMKKNKTAQSCGMVGMRRMASGYTMKASPGPSLTTSVTATPCWAARKPITVNTAKPANTAVKRLVTDTMMASLQTDTKYEKIGEQSETSFLFLDSLHQRLVPFLASLHRK